MDDWMRDFAEYVRELLPDELVHRPDRGHVQGH